MTVTIQRTSKPLKATKLLANIIQLVGIGIMIAGGANHSGDQMFNGFLTILAGIGLHVIAQALVWWNHE